MLFTLLCVWTALLLGQPGPSPQTEADHSWAKISGEARDVRFDSFSRADGIPTDQIFQVLQDRRGFTWFTTLSGLYRWDGYQCVRYPGMPMFRPYNALNMAPGVLHEARNGNLWVASEVITPFDPSTGKFGSPLNVLSRPARSLNDAVTGLFEDSQGALWVGVSTYQSDRGQVSETSEPVLYQINPTTRAIIAHPIDPRLTQGRAVGVRAIEQDRHGHFWLGTSIGLMRFDPQSGSFQHFPHQHPGEHTLQPEHFNALIWDKTGHLWVHLPTGIERFDPETGVFDRFTAALCRYMRADPSGRFWLSYGGRPSAMVFDPYQPAETALRAVSYRSPGSPAQPTNFNFLDPDRQGNIWAYLGGIGIVRYSPAAARFGKHLPELNNPNSLNGKTVTGIAENPDGAIWVSTAYTGLALFDPRSDSFTQFHHNPNRPDGLDTEWVTSVYVDRSGAVWVATAGDSILGTFERTSGRYRVIRDHAWLRGAIYSMFEDSTGRLWVSSGLGETRAIDLRTRTVLPQEIKAYVTREDPDGNLWFGFEPGLTKLDRAGNLRSIPLPVPESNPAFQPRVRSLHIDVSGILWVGTTRGLFRFDPHTEKSTRYAMNEGLPVESVVSILPDGDGNLWLGTSRGISRFDTAGGRFYNYDEGDGLQPLAFLTFASLRASDGRLYFGGNAGFNSFYPRDILARAPDAHIVLTSLQVKDRPPLTAVSDRISAPYAENDLSIEFAALNVINPGNLIYRFRLEPQESRWIETDSAHRVARYTDLSPGSYLFRSQVSTDGRTWSDREATLRITVTPPWWGAWWARTAAVLFLAGVFLGSYKARVRALKTHQRRLAELVDRRTAELATARDRAEAASSAKSIFLANMSHELRNPLSSILGITSLLREEASGENREYLEMINRSGEQLLTIIDDVLDMAKVEAGKQEAVSVPVDVVTLARDLTEMMRVKAAEKNLDLSCVCARDVPHFVRIDAAKLRQVLMNLLSNALKFTEAGAVTLRLTAKSAEQSGWTRLRFQVEDTGRGIAPDDQERIFQPFVQVGKRAAQKGTGLGLAITRQFVELMGGTITVESSLGRGSLFCVEVPAEVAKVEEVANAGSFTEAWLTLAPDQPEFRVLIVEDDPQNALVLEQMLGRAGFEVRLVERAADGIEIFQQWSPHFIWMDLWLPDMNGTDAVRRIRELEHGGTVKIAAMTASAFESDRERVLAAGMDDFVCKPYRSAEIFDCLARQLPVHFSRAEPMTVPPATIDRIPPADARRALPGALHAEPPKH